ARSRLILRWPYAARHGDEDDDQAGPDEEEVENKGRDAEDEHGSIGDGEKRPDQARPEEQEASDKQLRRLHCLAGLYGPGARRANAPCGNAPPPMPDDRYCERAPNALATSSAKRSSISAATA